MNNDLISRSALFKTWDALDETQDPNLLVDAMIKATQEAPAVDTEPVRHGRWMQKRPHNTYWYCSECGDGGWYCDVPRGNYCPNCGARMDGGAEHAVN